VALRRQGLSLQQIADRLNAAGIPTPAGRDKWLKSHVDRLLNAAHVQELALTIDSIGVVQFADPRLQGLFE
jgi:hypothetical protein